MKKKASQKKLQYIWKRKVFATLILAFCLGSFVFIQARFNGITASLESLKLNLDKKPQIAFLFIARNRLPLEFVWDAFFLRTGDASGRCFGIKLTDSPENWEFLLLWPDNIDTNISLALFELETFGRFLSWNGEDGKFSIFVHSRPGFILSEATTQSKYFLNRQVNDSIQVDWGEATMIEAERVLLRHALRDPFNHRFVFLSDSCIPLYSFSYTYNYIMSTSTSFVDSFADTKDSRYNPRMNPIIPVHNWRKGSQWVVLNRKHAEIVVNDTIVLPVFQQHCRRKSLPEFWRDRPVPAEGWKEHNCIPDEHYVQTLLAQKGVDSELTRRSLTHSAWDLYSSKSNERRGWHPMTYKFSDATRDLIQSIKGIVNINYETEYRREWCSSKGKPSPCFLFARKFTRPAAVRLLRESILLRDKERDS